VLQFLQAAARRPRVLSELEEERERNEFFLLMREIDQARHETRPADVGPRQRRSAEERNDEAVEGFVGAEAARGLFNKKQKRRGNR
jgi:hypothetical protein